jgi:hypothetical protein
VVGACRLDGWASPVQPRLLHTLFNRLLGQDLDFLALPPLAPSEVAAAVTTQAERDELIQLMVVLEILGNPLSPTLERSVARWAAALHVHDADFFRHAAEPLDEVRARFGVPPKSQKMVEMDLFGALELPPGA